MQALKLVPAALALAGLAFLSGCASGAGSAGRLQVTDKNGAAASGYAGLVVDQPYPMPDVTLQDTQGKPFDLRARTAGKVSLVFFGYTNCPDICSTTMADLSEALRRVPDGVRAAVQVIFVTTDPARDTGPVLRAWLDRFGYRTPPVGLTGTEKEIAAAAKPLGVPITGKETTSSGGYTIGHGSQVLGFSPDDQAHVLWLSGTTVKDYAHDIERLTKDSKWQ